MKVILNKCYGGFGLSAKAYEVLGKKRNIEYFFYIQTGYEHEGNEEYTKVTANEADNRQNSLFFVLDKDFGLKIHKLPNNYHIYERDDKTRTDKNVIEVVEELGDKASGKLSRLVIVEIPDDIEWEIDDYDGIESVHEKHRSW